MSLKSHVDKEIILQGRGLPLKGNIPEKVITTSFAVSHSTKVSQQTSVKSTTKIQALPQGVRIENFEIGQCTISQE